MCYGRGTLPMLAINFNSVPRVKRSWNWEINKNEKIMFITKFMNYEPTAIFTKKLIWCKGLNRWRQNMLNIYYNTRGATCESGSDHLSEESKITPSFCRDSCYSYHLSFRCCIYFVYYNCLSICLPLCLGVNLFSTYERPFGVFRLSFNSDKYWRGYYWC